MRSARKAAFLLGHRYRSYVSVGGTMLRKILPLMFLLIFIASDSALARRHRRCWSRPRVCCSQQARCCSKAPETYDNPNYCLRDIYMEFNTPPHLYYCLTYDDSCPPQGGGEVYDDLWYGYPTRLPLPQSCYEPDTKCEGQSHDWGGSPPPGHGHQTAGQHPHSPFTNTGQACKWLRDNYAPRQNGGHTGKPCDYYKFPFNVGGPIWAVLVPSPTQAGRYFGVETGNLSGNPNVINSAQVRLAKSGNVVAVDFDDGTNRKAVIWLKDHRTP
jgi:hypothetical protein